MKKLCFLTSLAAIVATGVANAANATTSTTDVTFGGKYSLATDTEGAMSGVVNSEPNATDSQYNWNYITFNGETTASQSKSSDFAPVYSDFKYIDTNGDAVALTADTEFASAEDYTKSVDADRTFVFNQGESNEYTLHVYTTETDLYANGQVSKSNYTYEGLDGEIYQLDEQPTFTDTHTLLSSVGETEGYTIVLADGYDSSVSATNGEPTLSSLDGSKYILHASNGLDFRLTEDGTGFRRLSDGATVDTSDYSDYAGEFTALQNAYTADYNAIYGTGGIVETTQNSYNDVAADYEKALSFYEADRTDVATLTSQFESQQQALDLYNDAVQAQSVAYTNFEKSHEAYENASSLYNSSVIDTINNTISVSLDEDGAINSAINTAVANESGRVDAVMGKVHGLISDNGDGTNSFNGTNATASTNVIDGEYKGNLAVGTTVEDHLVALDNAIGTLSTLDTSNNLVAGSVADNLTSLDNAIVAEESARIAGDAATLESAKNYADTQDALTLNAAKAYVDSNSALTLNQSKSYTDSRIHKLDKELSGGVAAATALSSVEVSNVKKGEVSVGGGYGYYNSQSAMAFGAAMGLSDNWSVNAGAGIASGDKTQVAFRAGTNYKFKLF